ncbi:unnamed protein product, partial [Adineta steineri]
SNLTSLEFDVTGIGLTDIEEYLFKMFPNLSEALIVDFTPSPQDKIEEQLGLDINKDGRINRALAGGDNLLSMFFSFILGLIGKIEKATHIDLNGDGRIGSGNPYHTSQHKH